MKFKRTIYSILFLIFTCNAFSQGKPIIVEYYYPKDSLKFEKNVSDFDFNYEKELYGKTTMIIHCESEYGNYEFVFKKKIIKLERIINYEKGGVGEVYNFETKKWEHDVNTWKHTDFNTKPIDTILYSTHNLYAFILLADHGGYLEKVKFQDFGNEVYWPEFDYPNCSISDEDKDGKPEFYLSYMGESDGLDAKPYKQIIYTLFKPKMPFVKSKATAYYPAGNPEDEYYEEFDKPWQLLSKPIQKKSKEILNNYKIE